MEQGATGNNSSVPTASLTGRIRFFCCRYELLLTTVLRQPFPGRPSPFLDVPAIRRAFARASGPDDRFGYEPGRSGALATTAETGGAWLTARAGGADPTRSAKPGTPLPQRGPCNCRSNSASEGMLLESPYPRISFSTSRATQGVRGQEGGRVRRSPCVASAFGHATGQTCRTRMAPRPWAVTCSEVTAPHDRAHRGRD